jgi:DnaJ-class molecular chaperone
MNSNWNLPDGCSQKDCEGLEEAICPQCGGSGIVADPNKFGEPENERQCARCYGEGVIPKSEVEG